MADQSNQTMYEELGDRFAEGAPARQIPFLLGVENLRYMWRDWRIRNRDDHALSMKALGAESTKTMTSAEAEDMGDITVAGDTTKTEVHHHYPVEAPPAAAAATQPTKDAGLLSKVLPLAAAAGLGAGGLWLANNWPPFEWPTPPDAAYEIRFFNSKGELIEVPRQE